MTHQAILDKLAAKHLVQAMDEDLARLLVRAMSYARHDAEIAGNVAAYILPQIRRRWDCVLQAQQPQATDHYKQKAWLAMAVSLHKYGLADREITEMALQAIDGLNEAVVLSDDFFRKSKDIKAFILTAPVVLKRKPAAPDNITFYRPADVIAIQMAGQYFAAYIHRLGSINESPVVEFYDGIFDSVPALGELEKLQAKGMKYNDGVARIARYSLAGLKYLPDPAGQVHLVRACVAHPPADHHLQKPVGLYTVSDIFEIQDHIKTLFLL